MVLGFIYSRAVLRFEQLLGVGFFLCEEHRLPEQVLMGIARGRGAQAGLMGRKVADLCCGQKGLPKGCFPGPGSSRGKEEPRPPPKADTLGVGDPF